MLKRNKYVLKNDQKNKCCVLRRSQNYAPDSILNFENYCSDCLTSFGCTTNAYKQFVRCIDFDMTYVEKMTEIFQLIETIDLSKIPRECACNNKECGIVRCLRCQLLDCLEASSYNRFLAKYKDINLDAIDRYTCIFDKIIPAGYDMILIEEKEDYKKENKKLTDKYKLLPTLAFIAPDHNGLTDREIEIMDIEMWSNYYKALYEYRIKWLNDPKIIPILKNNLKET
jgi:hypothetical protein